MGSQHGPKRVPERPATTALVAALRNRERNALALGSALGVFAIAAVVGSPVAYYAAALVAFCIWMAWFVTTVIDWISLADF